MLIRQPIFATSRFRWPEVAPYCVTNHNDKLKFPLDRKDMNREADSAVHAAC